MGKSFKTPDCRRIPVGGREYDFSNQGVHQAALPGNTEFTGKICMDMGNGLHEGVVFPFLKSWENKVFQFT